MEAGFEPLEWNRKVDEERIFDALIPLIRKYRRYPTRAEILIEKRSNSQIPVPNVLLRRFGERANVIQEIRNYCAKREAYADVEETLAKETMGASSKPQARLPEAGPGKLKPSGYVYLVKSGKLHKIGLSAENHWRRKSELHRQTSEGIVEVHTISAIDDAPGIEKYWHERFKDKRTRGEWFDLSAEDISAFKKRKWM